MDGKGMEAMYKLCQFRGPQAGCNASLAGYPMSIHIYKGSLCSDTLWSREGPNEDSIGVHEIAYGSPFCKEFWIGEDVKSTVGR